MSDIEPEIVIFNKIRDFSKEDQEKIIEIYKQRVKATATLEKQKQNHKSLQRFLSMCFGTALAGASLYLAAHAINSQASLLELAALLTPVAGLAGVFLWGFQRKD